MFAGGGAGRVSACLILGVDYSLRQAETERALVGKARSGRGIGSRRWPGELQQTQKMACSRTDPKRAGGLVEEKAQFSGASMLLSIFVVLAACKLGQSVIEPVVFALFVIAIVWPLANALQKRIPGWAALLLTV